MPRKCKHCPVDDTSATSPFCFDNKEAGVKHDFTEAPTAPDTASGKRKVVLELAILEETNKKQKIEEKRPEVEKTSAGQAATEYVAKEGVASKEELTKFVKFFNDTVMKAWKTKKDLGSLKVPLIGRLPDRLTTEALDVIVVREEMCQLWDECREPGSKVKQLLGGVTGAGKSVILYVLAVLIKASGNLPLIYEPTGDDWAKNAAPDAFLAEDMLLSLDGNAFLEKKYEDPSSNYDGYTMKELLGRATKSGFQEDAPVILRIVLAPLKGSAACLVDRQNTLVGTEGARQASAYVELFEFQSKFPIQVLAGSGGEGSDYAIEASKKGASINSIGPYSEADFEKLVKHVINPLLDKASITDHGRAKLLLRWEANRVPRECYELCKKFTGGKGLKEGTAAYKKEAKARHTKKLGKCLKALSKDDRPRFFKELEAFLFDGHTGCAAMLEGYGLAYSVDSKYFAITEGAKAVLFDNLLLSEEFGDTCYKALKEQAENAAYSSGIAFQRYLQRQLLKKGGFALQFYYVTGERAEKIQLTLSSVLFRWDLGHGENLKAAESLGLVLEFLNPVAESIERLVRFGEANLLGLQDTVSENAIKNKQASAETYFKGRAAKAHETLLSDQKCEVKELKDYKAFVPSGTAGVAAANSQAAVHKMSKHVYVICCPHKMDLIKGKSFKGSRECVRVVPQEALLEAKLIDTKIASAYNEYIQRKNKAEAERKAANKAAKKNPK